MPQPTTNVMCPQGCIPIMSEQTHIPAHRAFNIAIAGGGFNEPGSFWDVVSADPGAIDELGDAFLWAFFGDASAAEANATANPKPAKTRRDPASWSVQAASTTPSRQASVVANCSDAPSAMSRGWSGPWPPTSKRASAR